MKQKRIITFRVFRKWCGQLYDKKICSLEDCSCREKNCVVWRRLPISYK